MRSCHAYSAHNPPASGKLRHENTVQSSRLHGLRGDRVRQLTPCSSLTSSVVVGFCVTCANSSSSYLEPLGPTNCQFVVNDVILSEVTECSSISKMLNPEMIVSQSSGLLLTLFDQAWMQFKTGLKPQRLYTQPQWRHIEHLFWIYADQVRQS